MRAFFYSLWDFGKDQKQISFSIPKEGEFSEFLSSDDEEEVEELVSKMSKVDVSDKPFQPPVAAPVATPEVNLSPQGTSSSWHSLNRGILSTQVQVG